MSGTVLSDKIHDLLSINSFEGQTVEEFVTLNFANRDSYYTGVNSLEFRNVIFLKDFVFRNFNISAINKIEFKDCVFEGEFKLFGVQQDQLIVEFLNCTFFKNFLITSSKLKILTCNKSKINTGRIHAIESSDVLFNDCEIRSNLRLSEVDCYHTEITLESNHLLNSVFIDSPKMSTVLIEGQELINKVQIDAVQTAYIRGRIDEVRLYESKFESIIIEAIWDYRKKLSTRSHINKLSFSDTKFDGSLKVEETDIEELKFDALHSTNGIIRLNEMILRRASFVDCTVLSLYWNQVEFLEAPEIIKCDLSKLKMSNVIWPNAKRLKNSFLDEKIPWYYNFIKRRLNKNEPMFNQLDLSDLRYQRDAYRQLKAASLANNNQVEALDFYKNEMQLYWKEIRLDGGVSWNDRFLIFVDRWSSNFGQNWWMPVIWLLIFHLFLCTGIWISEAQQHELFNYDYLNVSNGVKEYFFWLIPIYKTPTDWGAGAMVFGVLSRVINGFFIYHIIKATRKYGKL